MIENIIENSNYYLLPDAKNIEVERIEEKYKSSLIYYLRIRNSTDKSITINSFVVAEFIIPDTFTVTSVLENNWLQCSEISYKNINESTIKNKTFLQRDQNPYSFKKEYGYIDSSIISEWFTSINFKNDNLFVGAVTTKNQFTQVYIKKEDMGTFVRITCQYDGLKLNPGEVIKSEKIFIRVGDEEKNKQLFSEALAYYMKVKKVVEPIKAACCSYYWNKNKITDQIINKELDALEKFTEKLDLDYIQFDAGYTPYFGDWLDYKDRFPNGFENIINRIKKLGYKAGIWLSPFCINPFTKLHDHHKSWLLKGNHKEHFEGRWTSPLDDTLDVTNLEVLDPTRDEVKEYLKGVLLHFKNLGFTLFKIDFLYPVCLSNNYSKPMTRAQALREGLEFIRNVLGEDVKILTGITQLSSVVGIADFVRTGIDSLNPFVSNIPFINTAVNEFMFERNLKETELRSFLNGVIWRADPDVLIFGNNSGISEKVIKRQKKFVKENNMSMWIGDCICTMNENNKKKLLKYFNG